MHATTAEGGDVVVVEVSTTLPTAAWEQFQSAAGYRDTLDLTHGRAGEAADGQRTDEDHGRGHPRRHGAAGRRVDLDSSWRLRAGDRCAGDRPARVGAEEGEQAILHPEMLSRMGYTRSCSVAGCSVELPRQEAKPETIARGDGASSDRRPHAAVLVDLDVHGVQQQAEARCRWSRTDFEQLWLLAAAHSPDGSATVHVNSAGRRMETADVGGQQVDVTSSRRRDGGGERSGLW